jgi:anti-anti-sigma regulatory factor
MKSDAISIERSGDNVVIALAGRWIIERANDLNRGLEALAPGPAKAITIDLGPVESLDTAGA